MNGESQIVTLSLISHTNAGKTTLARTLLREDIGEVRDEPHVTDISEAHPLLETPDGSRLLLWDTPGFGDTARLLRRLKQSRNPVGWVLTQAWDRFTDRPLWCSQQAVRNVRDEADVVLYLVNAAEDPADAAYVDVEMKILSWIGKPVILLLNQTGPPRSHAEEVGDEEQWRSHLREVDIVRDVLKLDAFARCWVQEGRLLRSVARLLSAEKQPMFDRLSAAWRDKNLEIFHHSMTVLAAQLTQATCDYEVLEQKTWAERARSFFFPISGGDPIFGKKRAMANLAGRLDRSIRDATDELIKLHGLEGRASGEVLQRLRENYSTKEPFNEGFAAVLGGFVSGALGGLWADIAAAGLSFGSGAVGGGILGALGAGGLARGYNLVQGEESRVRWSAEFFQGLTRSALLRYLAVAHFGRGRGNWEESEHPQFWQDEVAATVDASRNEIRSVWERGNAKAEPIQLRTRVEDLLTDCAREILEKLYPGAGPFVSD